MRMTIVLAVSFAIAWSAAYLLAGVARASRPYATADFALVKPSNTPWPNWGTFAQPAPGMVGSLTGWAVAHALAAAIVASGAVRVLRAVVFANAGLLLFWAIAPIALRMLLPGSGNLADAVHTATVPGWMMAVVCFVVLVRSTRQARDRGVEPIVHRGGDVAGALSDSRERDRVSRGDYA